LGVKKYKKQKAPKYTEDKKIKIERKCPWLYQNFEKMDFIIDDEKYFTLSNSNIAGNDIYYSWDKSKAPINVTFKCKQKFEPKVLLWLGVSNKWISTLYFQIGGLAINQSTYTTKGLKTKLLPLICKYHPDKITYSVPI
jgi:hypothetical protein